MTVLEIVISVLISLAANECCEVSPWAARKLVRWSAHHRYQDPARAEDRAEELCALIDDRPGKLLKFLTASGFAVGAVIVSAHRRLSRDPCRQARLSPEYLPALIWNWRYELGIAAATAGATVSIVLLLGAAWLAGLAITVMAITAALLGWEPARKRIIARAWCVITPHRIRVGCLHAWVQTMDGRPPIVLYAEPTVFGERVMVWCREGIAVEDLVAARDILTFACWAIETRVLPANAPVVAIDVIRRK
jgi:hypothetical protein